MKRDPTDHAVPVFEVILAVAVAALVWGATGLIGGDPSTDVRLVVVGVLLGGYATGATRDPDPA